MSILVSPSSTSFLNVEWLNTLNVHFDVGVTSLNKKNNVINKIILNQYLGLVNNYTVKVSFAHVGS